MTSFSLVRHWLSGFSILVSIGMVILGQTVFAGQLQGYDYVFYWGVCLVMTLLAAFAAIYEMAAIRRQSQREEHRLRQETFGSEV